MWWRDPYIGLVGRRTSAGGKDDPGIFQLDVAGIFLLYDFSAQDADVKFLGFCLVLHGEKVRNKKSLLRYRYVGWAHDHTSSERASLAPPDVLFRAHGRENGIRFASIDDIQHGRPRLGCSCAID